MINDYEPKTESLLDGDFSCETTEDWELRNKHCFQYNIGCTSIMYPLLMEDG